MRAERGLLDGLPLPRGGHGFLSSLRVAGGRDWLGGDRLRLAEECRRRGYAGISGDGEVVWLTPLGVALLDRLARAE